jgi:hypothetical protein
MLDPISFTVASLLAWKAAEGLAEGVGHSAWNHLDRLRRVVLERFHADARGADAVAALEASPADAAQVENVARRLDEYMRDDPGFRELIANEIEHAARHRDLGRFITQVANDAKVGKIVNIGEVHGDVTF